jgi:hypothetical protein
MRALPIFLAATVLLTTASAAYADAESTDPRRATTEQMDKATGAYKLSDGRRAEIFALDTRLYMKIGRGRKQELLLVGPNRLAARNGSVSVQFESNFGNDHIVLEQDGGIGQLDTIHLASSERSGRGSGRAD